MQSIALLKALREADRARTLASCVLAVLVAASAGVLAAGPAHAATFSVNRTGDAPDANLNNAACDSNASARGNQCTLRAAIREANDTAAPDTINFNIGGNASVKTISPGSALPTIKEEVTINGYTQTGASPNTLAEGNDAVLKVQLNGANAGAGTDGLSIGLDESTIKGLVINRFDGAGIAVSSFGVTGTKIEGNFIGTSAAGTAALGNGEGGVDIASANNTVGGTASGARNVISGNESDGVQILGGINTASNEVLGNYIGTDKNGTQDLGNTGNGVDMANAANNTVGGTAGGARNIISGNEGQGVQIRGGISTGNRILGNFIGTAVGGTAPLGNSLDGVGLDNAQNTVGGTASSAGNRIAFNGENGVVVGDSRTGNRILSNSIFSNTGLGIDLSGGNENDLDVTANDTDDPDIGANNLQNFPVIGSATRLSTGVTIISGTLNTNPNQDVIVQCFVAVPDPSGHGEGQIPAGKDNVTADAGGDASFACISPVPQAGQLVTATATKRVGGDTSEFSLNRAVSVGP